jgi:hypothetical protein
MLGWDLRYRVINWTLHAGGDRSQCDQSRPHALHTHGRGRNVGCLVRKTAARSASTIQAANWRSDGIPGDTSGERAVADRIYSSRTVTTLYLYLDTKHDLEIRR